MNNRYTQQPGFYGSPQAPVSPYDGSTCNITQNVTKGPPGPPPTFPPQKSVQGPPPLANMTMPAQPPCYNNNTPAGNPLPGMPPMTGGRGNLTNQMSGLSLTNQQQRPPSVQNFPPPSIPGNNMNSAPPAPPSNVNGFNTPSERPPLDSTSHNDTNALQQPPGILGGPPLPGQPLRQAPNRLGLPPTQQQQQQQQDNSTFARHSGDSIPQYPMNNQQQYPPAMHLSGPPPAVPQQFGQSNPMVPPNVQGQQPLPPTMGYNLPGNQRGPIHGQQNIPGNFPVQQQQHSGPMVPGQEIGGAGLQRLPQQYLSGPPIPGQTIGSPINRQPSGIPPGYPQQQQPDPYAGQRAGAPYPSGVAQPQQQQARRLHPDQMPSPIQVMQEDQQNRGGVFITNQKGLVPPLVTTKYITQDQGNASPRFIRSTMYTVPTSNDIMKQAGVPFGLIVSPMAQVVEGEYEPPIVDMGEIGPVRCIRCKAYMSPFMQFIDAGRRFQCMFCRATSEVPQEYFQHLDHTGQRMDRFERPELMLGTYEYTATTDYCRNNVLPKPPAIIFVIDVSYNTVKSGLVNLICSEMKKIISNLPIDAGQEKTGMKVGFVTYNNTVHFYNVNARLTQPQMMVVGDVQDVFMPLLDGFLCDPEESEAVIDALMTQIPTMFADTRETETILAPAIQAGLEALKASERPGKLMVFHSSLPIAEAPGKLKNRDDRKVLGTEKEKTVLAPQTNVYNNLGQECVSAGCSVDLFVFNNSYVDIATIGQVCRLTGGEVYKYTYFQADIDGERLVTDIVNNISRPIAFDAVMRVRTSTGVRATDFYGHFFMSNTTDMELGSIDCNKAIAIEIKHDDKLTDEEGVYVQAALLYTSCGGVRRLRIINLSLRTSSQMAELYRACDLDAVINFFSKQSVFKLIESTPKTIKEGLIARCATILATYRKNCAAPSSAGQLILPECMKLLPLYVNCLLKSDAISGGADMTIDDRSYVMQAVATMPMYTSVIYFYPRLLPLHDIDPQDTELPQQLRCSFDKFVEDGAYLLENGIHMFLWLGQNLSSDWINQVFGSTLLDSDRTSLPVLDNLLNKRIRDIITRVRAERHHCMRLTIVRQREKLEMVLRHFLVEDRGNDASPSYIDFLCHTHKEIKALLSQ